MASRRTFFVSSGLVSIGGTGVTPALYATTATGDFNIVKCSVAVEAGSSPAPPVNGSVLFELCTVTGTAGGGGSVTPAVNGPGTVAAISTWTSAASAAITGLTKGAIHWSHPCALAAGAFADEWFPDGFEKNVTTSGLIAMYFTAASGAGAGMNAKITLEIAE